MSDERSTAFAALLAQAIRSSGLTLDGLRLRLRDEGVRISVATLSYWQNGRSQPTSAHAVHTLSAIERVLDMPAGALVKAAPVAQTRSRGSVASRTCFPLPRDVREAVAMTGLDAQALRKVSTHFTVTLAEDRTQSSEVVRSVVQCLVSGTRSFPLVGTLDEGVEQDVTGLSNCSVGETVDQPDAGLRVTEMLLPRPLRQGELLMLEYMTTFGPGGEPSRELLIAVPKLSELVVEVQFVWPDQPRRVVGFSHDPNAQRNAADDLELPLSAASAQLVLLDTSPSVVGLQWQW